MQAVILTKKRVTKHAKKLAESGFSPRLRFGQFHPEPPSITSHLNSRNRHYLVSLPEIQSLTLALKDYLRRRGNGGEIDVFTQTGAERNRLLQLLKGTKLTVFQPTSDAPTVRSIITFKPASFHPSSPDVKSRLQNATPPITLPSIIADDQRNPFLRVTLSEIKPRNPNELRHLAYAIRQALKPRRKYNSR